MGIIYRIKNYFEDKYILKTFKNSTFDIKQSNLEFNEIMDKYDIKRNFHKKVLTYSILTAVCEFDKGSELDILKKVYSQNISYINSLNSYNEERNLEILKMKTELSFLKFKQRDLSDIYIDEEDEEELNEYLPKEFSPKIFSSENFTNAISCIHCLTENNKKYSYSYCKSYKTLEYTKSSIELAFNYLLDSIKFDKNCEVYNNNKFAEELRGMHMAMILTYVNDEFEKIPKDKLEQVRYNSERKINIGENELEITKLIKWRNKEQWSYFANAFGTKDELGKLCLERSH